MVARAHGHASRAVAKEIVMATAWGYQAGVYRAFLGTLRATGYIASSRFFSCVFVMSVCV